MADDPDIRLKREAKTSLQAYKDQSLLRRRFGDAAVRLYDSIDSGRPASQLMAELGLGEQQFFEILEFMNNNAMVSVVSGEIPAQPPKSVSQKGAAAAPQQPEKTGEEPATQEEGPPEQEETAPSSEQGRIIPLPGRKSPDEQLLSPLEKILNDKYGPVGVRVYNLIDGEKTAEEILKQTGVSEAKLVEILEFMDEQGIIKLEKPASPEEKEEEEKEAPAPAQEPRFKPMLEEEPEAKPFVPPKAPEKKKEEPTPEEPEEDIVMVDVPVLSQLTLTQKALLFAELSTRFGREARVLMDMVDGQRDFIDLSLGSGLSFFDVDAIMAYFGKKGFVSFRQLTREEIKKKYGEDGFAIYKKFGRDGLLLYEMIGKEASLRDIITKSRLDPDRAIDILLFIHNVLGLDVPIDRNVIYRQLGLRK